MSERINTKEVVLGREPYICETGIKGLLLVKRPRFYDARGSFQENYRTQDLENALGYRIQIVQSQLSFSKPNVLRGIHAENQTKVITPITGKILSVVVDLRKGSETFGQYVMFDIDNDCDDNQLTTLCIARGLGNSLYVYPDSGLVRYMYSVTSLYNPKNDKMGVWFNDPFFEIPWPIEDNAILSEKDKNLPSLATFMKFVYG
ncbi:MAG TPA: dTDP-4-dehydrorhamnose 3,5-epimerase [Candidatus Saccharimonadales bacterium]|nr:dTDP-4-dehydrorhamnose 3,5-epimerase [Candidatus Saccharimonadales bacterium]